jgi:LysM repeat protein
MRKICLFVVFLTTSFFWAGCDTFPQVASAQPSPQMTAAGTHPDSRQVELANLRADVQALDRRVREMSIAMEDLVRRNRELSAEIEQQKRRNGQLEDLVGQAQLERAIQDLNQRMQAANAEQRRQIIREVTQQIESLGKQTQAAIDALARNVSSRPAQVASRPSFSDDFPREGVSYTVRSGDTLSAIATRHNSTVRDIQNANQISNPASIQVGQVLFIPQRSN